MLGIRLKSVPPVFPDHHLRGLTWKYSSSAPVNTSVVVEREAGSLSLREVVPLAPLGSAGVTGRQTNSNGPQDGDSWTRSKLLPQSMLATLPRGSDAEGPEAKRREIRNISGQLHQALVFHLGERESGRWRVNHHPGSAPATKAANSRCGWSRKPQRFLRNRSGAFPQQDAFRVREPTVRTNGLLRSGHSDGSMCSNRRNSSRQSRCD